MLFQFIYAPMESVVAFLMNILSRKHEFEAGNDMGYYYLIIIYSIISINITLSHD